MTVCALLTLFGSAVDALQVVISAKNRLLKEIADLRQRLILYDNPNTPPSKRPTPQRKRRTEADPDSPAKKRRPSAQPGIKKARNGFRLKVRNTTRAPNAPSATGGI